MRISIQGKRFSIVTPLFIARYFSVIPAPDQLLPQIKL